MKVWAVFKYYREEIHGDQLVDVVLFKSAASAGSYIVKHEEEILFDEFYFSVEERVINE